MGMNIKKSPVRLYASPKAVIALFLQLPGTDRIGNLVRRVETLSEEQVITALAVVRSAYAKRHRNLQEIFESHFRVVELQHPATLRTFSPDKQQLVGAFFTKEYSIQAAALFNPSIVAHPNQQNLGPGELRFVMSLRATGEGHISSIIFKTGVVD